MKINDSLYDQYLDFEIIEKKLAEMDEGEDVLHDLKGIDEAQIEFFKKLLAATNTQELCNYSTDAIMDYAKDLFSCKSLINLLHVMVDDTTILGNQEGLTKELYDRKLTGLRRIL